VRAAYALARREVVRFLRQPSRIVGAFAPPLLAWLLLGAGFGASFRAPGGASYLGWFFPGTVVLVVLFAAIFSTISVIEDRREGFLQAVVVSPASPLSVAAGKIAGGRSSPSRRGASSWPSRRSSGSPPRPRRSRRPSSSSRSSPSR